MDTKTIRETTIDVNAGSNLVDKNNNGSDQEINDQIKSNGWSRCVLNIFHIIWSMSRNLCCICVKFCTENDEDGIPKLMRSNCVKRKRNHN